MNFNEVPLGELVTLAKDTWKPTSEPGSQVRHYSIPAYDKGVYEIVQASEIASNKFTISKSSILYSKLNPIKPRIWRVEPVDEIRSVTSTEFLVLVPNEQADSHYIEALLTSSRFTTQAVALVNGTSGSHQRIQPSDLLSIEVPWPEEDKCRFVIGEQYRLLDEKIRVNQQIASTLEQIAQTIFRSWFVDFDPVHAKVRGELPVGMDAETAALFPDSFEDSELGLIPSGWVVKAFGDACKLVMGQSPPGDSYNTDGNGLPFYQGRTDFGTRFPSRRMYSTEGRRIANAGETLISVRAPVGDTNQATEQCVIGRGVAAAIHKSGSEIYTYCLLSQMKPQLEYYNGEGTVFGAINRKDFEALLALEPSSAVVSAFDELLGNTNAQIRNLHDQITSLTLLRDSLLPRLISGQLEIPAELLEA